MRSWVKWIGLFLVVLLSWQGMRASARAQAPPCDDPGPPPSGGYAAVTGTDNIRHWPVRWQFSLSYMWVWYSPAQSPPLVTTGSLTDPVPGGALGQPNTVILGGPLPDPGAAVGLRASFTYWLQDPEAFGLESTFIIMETSSQQESFASNAAGSPVLSRPYFNPIVNQEVADPRAVPGALRGSTLDSLTTRLMGLEVNMKSFAPLALESTGINFYVGARWLRLDETYSNFDSTTTIGAGGFATTLSDTFTTYNQFCGGQLGAELVYQLPRLTFGVLGKLAFGPNNQTINISGQTVQTDLTTGAVITDTQGFYAQPSNVGEYGTHRFALLAEAGARLDFALTNYLHINVGYTYLTLNRVARPLDQIDRTINIQPLLSGGGFAPALPAPPSFRQSSFNVHMLNLGLELWF